jgi:hypothetical protein
VIEVLLAGDTIRGVADHELGALVIPVTVVPSQPENPFHQRRTAEALDALLPQAVLSTGFREPPHPEFPAQRRAFVDHLRAVVHG